MQLLVQVAQVIQAVTAAKKNVQKTSSELTLQQNALQDTISTMVNFKNVHEEEQKGDEESHTNA